MGPDNKRLSVIIPMYNASVYIEDCLASLSNQSMRDFEVLLVDDCSTDDTVRKAERYPFRIIRLEKRLTPAQVRNRGVMAASGDILIFVDADVVLNPDSIKEIASVVSGPDVDAVSGMYTEDTPQAGFFSRFQNSILVYRYRKMHSSTTVTCSFFCAIKRNAFEAVGGYDEKMHYYEDIEIGNRLFGKGYRLKFEPGIKVTHLKYYDHLALVMDYFRKAEAAGLYIKRKGFGVMTKNGWPLGLKASSAAAVCLVLSAGFIKITAIPFLALLVAYSVTTGSFLYYLIKTHRAVFCLKSYFFLFEVFLVSFCGLCRGFLKRGRYD